MKGLGFGLGGNYASDNNVTGNFILPKYFVLNVNAFYDTKKCRIGVKVDNLTSEHYWTGYSTANPQTKNLPKRWIWMSKKSSTL